MKSPKIVKTILKKKTQIRWKEQSSGNSLNEWFQLFFLQYKLFFVQYSIVLFFKVQNNSMKKMFQLMMLE